MDKSNSTFRGGTPSWSNACVGDNGSPGYWEYSRGFSRAANLLIDLGLKNHGIDHPVDELVYPVCFNMRHSIELRLKGSIESLQILAKFRDKRLEFDFASSHDIGNIWH